MLRSEYSQELIEYARRWIGLPYIWGGNSPLDGGFDCSGFICWVLRREGLVGEHEDLTAQGLHAKFKKNGVLYLWTNSLTSLTLVFYGKSVDDITHVAMVTDQYHVIEAGGGNSGCDSAEKAKALGACVRERPINHRSDVVAALRPVFQWG